MFVTCFVAEYRVRFRRHLNTLYPIAVLAASDFVETLSPRPMVILDRFVARQPGSFRCIVDCKDVAEWIFQFLDYKYAAVALWCSHASVYRQMWRYMQDFRQRCYGRYLTLYPTPNHGSWLRGFRLRKAGFQITFCCCNDCANLRVRRRVAQVRSKFPLVEDPHNFHLGWIDIQL